MRKTRYRSVVLLYLTSWSLLAAIPTIGGEDDREFLPDSYHILSSVLASAGPAGASESFRIASTLGQSTPTGSGSNGAMKLDAGFWGIGSRIGIPTDVPLPDVRENQLLPGFPNPFNPLTTVRYTVAASNPVRIAVFDVKGRRIRTLVHEKQGPGRYEVVWRGRDDAGRSVATGTYFCEARIGAYRSVQKLMLIK